MRNEGGQDLKDPFDMFGGFENFGAFHGSLFGRNPFEDPFFTRPFGSMFRPSNLVGEPHPIVPPVGPIIQELDSDDDDDGEGDVETREDGGLNGDRPTSEPFVDHPDDETDDIPERTNVQTDYNRAGSAQPQTFRVHSSKVTYGGIDGVYYSSSSTRRMGSDGVIVEECKEADKSKGEARHRISRGLHDKGHSVTRKLNPDGKVDTMQILHNLKEDELGSFEEAWRSNSGSNVPSRPGSAFGSGAARMSDSFLLTSTERTGEAPRMEPHNRTGADPSGGRTRRVVRIPIE